MATGLAAAVALGSVAALLVLRRHGSTRAVPRPAVTTASPSTPAQLPPEPDNALRIGLLSLSGTGAIHVKLTAQGRISDGITGQKLASVPANKPLAVLADYATGQVQVQMPAATVERPNLVLTGGIIQIGGRRYPGKLRLSLSGTGLQLVNELEIEEYLRGVLPGELPSGFLPEAQKAQAIAARTYALVQRRKHGGFDLCDGTDCQMYVGITARSTRGLAAVKATRHQVLWSGDKLVYAFYEADCGGLSTRAEDVPIRDKPAEPLPYLRVVRDAPRGGADYCSVNRYHQWAKRLTREQLQARLNRRPETYVGQFGELRVLQRDGSGRVLSVMLRGSEPAELASADPTVAPAKPVEKIVTGWELRKSLGARTMKSTLVTIDEPQPDQFRIRGKGNGHGLGLCQDGANGMAKHGIGYRRILAHYYPGTRIAELAKPARLR